MVPAKTQILYIPVSPRCYHFFANGFCHAVADEYGAEHIHGSGAQLRQCQQPAAFTVAADPAGDAADPIPGQMPQQDVAGTTQVIRPSVAGGVLV